MLPHTQRKLEIQSDQCFKNANKITIGTGTSSALEVYQFGY